MPLTRKTREAGSILIVLVLMVVAVQVAAWKARPVMATSIKRARERELKFVLKEFKRGVLRYKKFNNRYPLKIEDLVSSPHPRYVRQLYADPMTGKKEWGVERDKTGSQIVGIKSLSKEKSMAGVEYSRWFYDDSLEFRVAIPEKLGEAGAQGAGQGVGSGQGSEVPGHGTGVPGQGAGGPGSTGAAGETGVDSGAGAGQPKPAEPRGETRPEYDDPNDIDESLLRGRRPSPDGSDEKGLRVPGFQ